MKRLAAITAALALAGCVTSEPPVAELPPADEAETAGLAGTAWRLVVIQSMDDTTYSPGDGDYTLTFGASGTVNMTVDCNRARAYYSATDEGALTFGPLALTRMQCAPDSLHDRYLAQIGYVRSYVQRDGKLFLATMADGAILEFEPIESGQ